MKNPFETLTVLAFVLLVFILWFVLGFLFPWIFDWNFAKNGQFGDGFGMVNALFSGIGIVALVYTIMLQRQTNLIQKQDLDKAHESMELQRLSNSFFSMATVLESMIQSIRLYRKDPRPDGSQVFEPTDIGRDAINVLYVNLLTRLRELKEQSSKYYNYNSNTNLFDEFVNDETRQPTGKSIKPSEYIKIFAATVIMFYERDGRHLKSYLNYVETIIEFIITEFKDKEQQGRYLNLFRSQFSQQELALLFYSSFNVFDSATRNIGVTLAKAHFLMHLDFVYLADMNHKFLYTILRKRGKVE